MFKKYIFLGIGIGLVLSSLLYYISYSVEKQKISKLNATLQDKQPSDDYVIQRAGQLGMIFFNKIETTSNDSSSTPKTSQVPDLPSATPTESTSPTATSEANADIPTQSPPVIIDESKYVFFTVKKNEPAFDIAATLESVGLVKDKSDFANYIIGKNLQRKLKFGTFLIPKDSSYDQITKILTN